MLFHPSGGLAPRTREAALPEKVRTTAASAALRHAPRPTPPQTRSLAGLLGDDDAAFPVGAAAGAAAAAGLLLIVAVAGYCCLCKRKKRRPSRDLPAKPRLPTTYP